MRSEKNYLGAKQVWFLFRVSAKLRIGDCWKVDFIIPWDGAAWRYSYLRKWNYAKDGLTLWATARMKCFWSGSCTWTGKLPLLGNSFGGETVQCRGFYGLFSRCGTHWQTRLRRVGRWLRLVSTPITTAEKWYQYFYFQEKRWVMEASRLSFLFGKSTFWELAISQGGGVGMFQSDHPITSYV